MNDRKTKEDQSQHDEITPGRIDLTAVQEHGINLLAVPEAFLNLLIFLLNTQCVFAALYMIDLLL